MPIRDVDNRYYMDEGFYVVAPKEHNFVAPHTHDFVEFIYMFSGHCIHDVDGQEYFARKGDLLFINHNGVHCVHSGNSSVYSDILIKPEFIDESLRGRENAFSLLLTKSFQDFQNVIIQENRLIHFSGEAQKRIETLLGWICEEEKKDNVGSPLMLRSYLNIFLTMVFREMTLPMQNKLDMNDALLSYIRSNCTAALPLSQTAKKCGYSYSQFSRLFKKLTGETYTAYLTRCRIDKACALLKMTNESVDSILYASGFTDRTQFFQKFMDQTGMTPANYRKMAKSNTTT